MTVGLGSGSTAALMVRHLAARIQQEGLNIIGVADQCGDRRAGASLEIPLRDLDEVAALDINLDGADEIDPQFRMIKGRGGALLREKIVAVGIRPSRHDDHGREAGRTARSIRTDPRGSQRLRDEAHRATVCSTSAPRRRSDGAETAPSPHGRRQRHRGLPVPGHRRSGLLDAQLQCLAGVLETGLFIGLCDT